METHPRSSTPSPDEAREALRVASAEEDATRNGPVPRWYFPVVAALVVVMFCMALVPLRPLAAVLTVAVAMAIAYLAGKVAINRPGYRGVSADWSTTLPAMAVAAAVPIAAIVLDGSLGLWVWPVAGAVLGCMVLGVGERYRRRYGHA